MCMWTFRTTQTPGRGKAWSKAQGIASEHGKRQPGSQKMRLFTGVRGIVKTNACSKDDGWRGSQIHSMGEGVLISENFLKAGGT